MPVLVLPVAPVLDDPTAPVVMPPAAQAALVVVAPVAAALADDARFHDVSWYTGEELHTGLPGASRPVEA